MTEARDAVERLVDEWLADAQPAAAEWPEEAFDLDPEILTGFVAETLDLLEDSEQAVLTLEAHPDPDAINSIFRAFHTIKGTSSFLGLAHITELAHRSESLLGRARDDHALIGPELVDLLIRCIDMLAQCARAAGAGDASPDTSALLHAVSANMTETDALASPADEARPASSHTAASPGEAWTRVRTDRLDRLLETIGEIVVTQSMLGREAGLHLHHESALVQLIATAGKNVRELQELSIGMRLTPLRSLFRKLTRLVHDLARRSGKPVQLVTEGEDTEIDRNLIEDLSDPLLHMLRNAVDHGIETPEQRRAANKPETARVRLTASRRGGNVVISLVDDGRGLNTERIREKAVQKGWLAPSASPTDAELLEYIFAPGFSTAPAVTDLSGRGVGLDVVRRNLHSLNGRIVVTSAPGQGCSFEIEVPLTLAITDGMLVGVGAEQFILPVINIQHSFRPEPHMLRTASARGEMVVLRDDVLPIVRLHRIFHVPGARTEPAEALLVVVVAGERRCALLVDELIGQQQVVSKPLSRALGATAGLSGAAILGNGRVGLITDIAEILDLACRNSHHAQAGTLAIS